MNNNYGIILLADLDVLKKMWEWRFNFFALKEG